MRTSIIWGFAAFSIVALLLVSSLNSVAQLPIPIYGVEVTCDHLNSTVEAGATAIYTILIRNTGQWVLGLGIQDTIDITVEGAPGGWNTYVSPSQVTLDAGTSASAILYVTPPENAMVGDSRTFTVKGTSQGDSSISDSTEPITTTAKASPTTDSDGDGYTDEFEKSVGTDPFDASSHPNPAAPAAATWIGIVIGLVCLGLIWYIFIDIYIVRGIRISCVAKERKVPSGVGSTTYEIVITNRNRKEDTIILNISEITPNWHAILDTPSVTLPAGSSASVNMMLISPQDAKSGEECALNVTATSQLKGTVKSLALNAKAE